MYPLLPTRDSPSIRAKVRYKVRIATCLPLAEFNSHLDLLFEFATLNSLRGNFTSGFVSYFSQAQRSSDYCSLSNIF